jgi:hypothetical protein
MLMLTRGNCHCGAGKGDKHNHKVFTDMMYKSYATVMKIIVLGVASLLLLIVALFSAQADNSKVQRMVDTVVTTDITAPSSSASEVVTVTTIKSYVHEHLGTHATFTLKGSYQRAVTAAQAAASSQGANAQIYAAAQAACGGKTDSITQAKCNAQYLSQHLVSVTTPAPVAAPKIADYNNNYRAPIWTPDLAGILLLIGGIGIISTIIIFIRSRI